MPLNVSFGSKNKYVSSGGVDRNATAVAGATSKSHLRLWVHGWQRHLDRRSLLTAGHAALKILRFSSYIHVFESNVFSTQYFSFLNIFPVILGAVRVYCQHHKRNTRTPSCCDKRQIWKGWETAKYGPTLTDKLGRWVKNFFYIYCQIVFCCFVVHFCCYYTSILLLLVIIVLPSINNNYFCRTCLHLACACEELHMS